MRTAKPGDTGGEFRVGRLFTSGRGWRAYCQTVLASCRSSGWPVAAELVNSPPVSLGLASCYKGRNGIKVGRDAAVVAYYRVSTEQQSRSGLGLDTQAGRCATFAAGNGLGLVNSYSAAKTWTAFHRGDHGRFPPTDPNAYNPMPGNLESETPIMVLSLIPTGPSPKEEATDPSFAELSVVALTRAVKIEGQSLPEGTLGTVVAAYGDGVGYEVEFERPFHAVVTLQAGDLTA